jgi:hypothetical protein
VDERVAGYGRYADVKWSVGIRVRVRNTPGFVRYRLLLFLNLVTFTSRSKIRSLIIVGPICAMLTETSKARHEQSPESLGPAI